MAEIESTLVNPLARAYCAAVRAGEITQDSAARQLEDGVAYILRHGVERTTPNMLRVVAALAETVAELKKDAR